MLLLILVGGIMLELGNFGVTAGGILGMIGPVGSLGPSVSRTKSTKMVRQDLEDFEKTGLEGKEDWQGGIADKDQLCSTATHDIP